MEKTVSGGAKGISAQFFVHREAGMDESRAAEKARELEVDGHAYSARTKPISKTQSEPMAKDYTITYRIPNGVG